MIKLTADIKIEPSYGDEYMSNFVFSKLTCPECPADFSIQRNLYIKFKSPHMVYFQNLELDIPPHRSIAIKNDEISHNEYDVSMDFDFREPVKSYKAFDGNNYIAFYFRSKVIINIVDDRDWLKLLSNSFTAKAY